MRKHAGPTALFAMLAAAWTWPLVLHLGDAVPGDPGDNYSFLWNLWWMRHVLATPGVAYFHTTYLFYPFGTTIADHPHTALPALVAATLLKPVSIVAAQNLLLIAYVFANMATMYALVWSTTTINAEGAETAENTREKRRRRGAILAAVMFGLSPYVAVHLLGHFDLVAAWVLPAFALALRGALRRGSTRATIAAGTILAATAYVAYYYVVYLWLFAIVYATAWATRVTLSRPDAAAARITRGLRWIFASGAAAGALIAAAIAATGGGTVMLGQRGIGAHVPQTALTAMWACIVGAIATCWHPTVHVAETSPGAWRRAITVVRRVGAVFAIGAAPLFWQAARLIAAGTYVTPWYGWRSAPRGIDLLAPFAGHPLHPLFHTFGEHAYRSMHADSIEAIAWIGIVPLLLLIVAVARRERAAEARSWLAVAAAFLIWSLGPFLVVGGFDTGLKLPEILARYVPFVANARMPGRAMVGVYMALAVLIGMAMSSATWLPPLLRAPAMQWIAIALVAFEYWDAPIRLTTIDRPPIYRTLANAAPGAVCEVPFGVGDGLSTGVGSQDRRALYYATVHEHPLAGGYIGRMPLDAVARYANMSVAESLMRLSDPRAPMPVANLGLAARPCRYLVVHRAVSSPALLAYVEQLPVNRIAADSARELYEFR
jgi:hypothetical protein